MLSIRRVSKTLNSSEAPVALITAKTPLEALITTHSSHKKNDLLYRVLNHLVQLQNSQTNSNLTESVLEVLG